MKSIASWLTLIALVAPLAAALRADGEGAAATAPDPPAWDRQVKIAFTVNNLGYTDTCG